MWPLHENGERAKALVVEFFDANKQEARLRIRSPPARWVLPKGDFYKVNYDALGYAGLGIAIRNCIGHVIAALSQKIRLPHFMETTEALAALRVVVF